MDIRVRAYDKEFGMADNLSIEDLGIMALEGAANLDNKMLYTGLPDMTGKEICEGDILDGSYINPMTKNKVTRIYVVIYERGSFIAKLHNHSPFGDTSLYFINGKSVIAGNIFENSELL